jgi:nucleotide-binding universal stress UspA family protein
MAFNCRDNSSFAAMPEQVIEKMTRNLGCDLIVIATHGRGAFGRFVMGSVTTRLLTISAVPVLVYRDQRAVDDFFD